MSMEERRVVVLQANVRRFLVRSLYSSVHEQYKIIEELVSTEKSLLMKMEIMKNKYQTPITQIKIVDFVFKIFLLFLPLDGCIKSSRAIVEIGEKFVDSFKIDSKASKLFDTITTLIFSFGEYAINYKVTKNVLNELKKNLIYKRMLSVLDANQNGTTFDDLIIEPMQRLFRYPMFIQSLLKTFDEKIESEKLEKEILVKTNHEFARYITHVNKISEMRAELMTVADRLDYFTLLVPRRFYIGGEIMTYNKKKCEGHLFNDRIIWYSIQKSNKLGKQVRYQLEGEIVFNDKLSCHGSKHVLIFGYPGLMPIQVMINSKKTIAKWVLTINSVIKSRVWLMKESNDWLHHSNNFEFVSQIGPIKQKEEKTKSKKKEKQKSIKK
ncbi:hypothetical protein EIN_275240 [Entamoeba invadens IP1]|uniref:DH domain-containing protein n=1 Tax=Entamoeba invadens IP1 TaxID=370355 RepID=A0A0A1U1P8_ENTIV|nr:hypothetical protein EIN_275240 [Entamoeba invadens IP1]ELP87937.1 hypothetical protein EIN_275240 [Entamoeba invadens IP1]|eukprot:XP_004254708.1 hypothetical protein EIN_275240 [Entamoeba invadens IP1]